MNLHIIYFNLWKCIKEKAAVMYLVHILNLFCTSSGQTNELKYKAVYISLQNSAMKQ